MGNQESPNLQGTGPLLTLGVSVLLCAGLVQYLQFNITVIIHYLDYRSTWGALWGWQGVGAAHPAPAQPHHELPQPQEGLSCPDPGAGCGVTSRVAPPEPGASSLGVAVAQERVRTEPSPGPAPPSLAPAHPSGPPCCHNEAWKASAYIFNSISVSNC